MALGYEWPLYVTTGAMRALLGRKADRCEWDLIWILLQLDGGF